MPSPSLNRSIALVVQETENAVVVTDAAGNVTWANPAFTSLFGYTFEEVQSRNPGDFLTSPEEGSAFVNAILQGLGEHRSYRTDLLLRRKAGDPLWLEITVKPIVDDKGLVECYIGVGVDITARKNAERELLKLSLAVEHSPVSVIITNRGGIIEYANPKACALTGYAKEELIGQNPRVLSTGAQSKEYYSRMWSTILSGAEWQGQFLNVKKNGDVYLEQASISPVRDAQGEITHFVAVKEDITERIMAEQALAAAKEAAEVASKAKSAFLAQMTHEIRTPMNAILGFSQLLQRDPGLTAEQRTTLDIITRSGEHLISLIGDVLEMSRIESGRAQLTPSPFDLVDMLCTIESMFRTRAEAQGLRFTVARHGEPLRSLVADHGKLRQIIINLLGNALKFTEHGVVELRIGLNRRGDGGLRLSVEVEDSGPGIAPADQERLFHRFEQAQAGIRAGRGTGLGLAICREYVTLLGGEISVSSRLGHGSVFLFHVPVKEGEVSDQSAVAERALPQPPAPSVEPQPVCVGRLPASLRDELRDAALAADIGRIMRCVAEAEAHDPDCAHAIRAIASRYDYPALVTLLDSAG